MEGSTREPGRPPGPLVVIRSSDGAAFPLTREDFAHVSTLDSLRTNLLSPLLSIPPDCLILMNERGIPLTRDEHVRELADLASTSAPPSRSASHDRARQGGRGAPSEFDPRDGGETVDRSRRANDDGRGDAYPEQEHRVYVFDREHLDADPEQVAFGLRLDEDMVLHEPPLNPEDPLSSHLSLSLHNLSTLRALTSSITYQRSSLSSALSNLHRVNTGTLSSFSLYLESAEPSLTRYENLLNGWEANMEAIKRVAIVHGLLVRGGSGSSSVTATGTAIANASGNGMGLGLGHQREASTAGAASRSGEEKQRFLGDYVSSEKMAAVRDGCAKVLAELRMRTEALQVTLDDVMANAEAVQADLDATSRDLEDLEVCEQDAEHGHLRIEELVQAGETMTDPELFAQCFEELSVCDAEHRDRIRFLIERKNAMTRYLLLQMQKISTLQSDIASMPTDLGVLDHDLRTRTENFKHLARLEGLIPAYVATAAEVVRRREYGRLVSTHASSLSAVIHPLTSKELDRRRHYRSNYSGKLPWEVRGLSVGVDEIVPEIMFDVEKRGVEGLPELGREALDQLRTSFEKLVGELSPTDDSVGARHPLSKAKELLDELVGNIDRLAQDFDRISSNALPPEPVVDSTQLALLESQVRQLEETNEALSRQLQSERSSHEELVTKLENRCSIAEGEREKEKERVRNVERERDDRNRKMRAAEEERDRSKHELDKLRVEVDEMQDRLEETTEALRSEEDKTDQLRRTLGEKDKEIKAVRHEAELDRAVLEKELEDLRRTVETKARELERGAGRNKTLEEIADGLRTQIARWEKVVQEKDEAIETTKRELAETRQDKEKGIVDVQKELVKARRQARAALVIAGKLRDENDTITRALNAPPPPKPDSSTAGELERAAQPTSPAPETPLDSSPPSLDYASGNIDELLRELEQVTHVALTDAIRNKMDGLTTLTKKWVKEAKAYRERAHRATNGASDKIAFRHFAKGDLALFLPTRNSTVPVWAAFNVSFPHHFLSPTGIIAEQMKTREWIVARITSLSETIVDAKDPSTNPYLLAAGTKFFLLEVEPWSSKEASRSRKHSSDKNKDKSKTGDRQSGSSGHVRTSRSTSDAIVPARSGSSNAADSAILVDRPTSTTSPRIRRTMSEGLPSNSTATARSDYAIVEVDERSFDADSRPPSPTTLRQAVPRSSEGLDSSSASPSGLARALARSQPATPTQQRSDPFVPSSPSPNPFPTTLSPAVGSPLRHEPASPPTTDYDPSHTATGASPAFLPSSGKKTYSAAGSSLGASSQSPRYVRSTHATRPDASKSVSISSSGNGGGRPSPTAHLLSSSPASSSVNSVRVLSHPRSASSGSSILSTSMHRRGPSSMQGVSPPVPSGKAPPTNEAQLTDSRWNLLHDGLAEDEQSRRATPQPKAIGTPSPKATPSGGPDPAPSTSADRTRSDTPTRGFLSSSTSTSSVFDLLKGKSRTGSIKGSSKESGNAEGEIRKLLGQPPF
ncbi:hypothetical protein JCM10212_006067 [Sporobolomyces blumeae]